MTNERSDKQIGGVSLLVLITASPLLTWRTRNRALCPQVILELFADAVVAAACNILAGVIVLPALSSHKLRDALAASLLKLAASVSGYAGALLVLS